MTQRFVSSEAYVFEPRNKAYNGRVEAVARAIEAAPLLGVAVARRTILYGVRESSYGAGDKYMRDLDAYNRQERRNPPVVTNEMLRASDSAQTNFIRAARNGAGDVPVLGDLARLYQHGPGTYGLQVELPADAVFSAHIILRGKFQLAGESRHGEQAQTVLEPGDVALVAPIGPATEAWRWQLANMTPATEAGFAYTMGLVQDTTPPATP